ncbi:hypothetical protein AZH53_08605 [Methanomicrobiaceae archaeon CYW5]|nr:hypothetical protein [Methanovulcanius yangii]
MKTALSYIPFIVLALCLIWGAWLWYTGGDPLLFSDDPASGVVVVTGDLTGPSGALVLHGVTMDESGMVIMTASVMNSLDVPVTIAAATARPVDIHGGTELMLAAPVTVPPGGAADLHLAGPANDANAPSVYSSQVSVPVTVTYAVGGIEVDIETVAVRESAL